MSSESVRRTSGGGHPVGAGADRPRHDNRPIVRRVGRLLRQAAADNQTVQARPIFRKSHGFRPGHAGTFALCLK